jgi:hypothetical protein
MRTSSSHHISLDDSDYISIIKNSNIPQEIKDDIGNPDNKLIVSVMRGTMNTPSPGESNLSMFTNSPWEGFHQKGDKIIIPCEEQFAIILCNVKEDMHVKAGDTYLIEIVKIEVVYGKIYIFWLISPTNLYPNEVSLWELGTDLHKFLEGAENF